jgi:uncharacterized protein YndB with AHSA1/START domain
MEFRKDQKKIYVKREFKAPVKEVWQFWTKSELLDQWWAPKPWKAVTKKMDFREGGSWLYIMKGPEGEQHFARADYEKIVPFKSFAGLDSFCDENGNIVKDPPSMHWNCRFSEAGENTIVDVEITFEKESDLEKIIELGFREGFTAALGNLDELLEHSDVKK